MCTVAILQQLLVMNLNDPGNDISDSNFIWIYKSLVILSYSLRSSFQECVIQNGEHRIVQILSNVAYINLCKLNLQKKNDMWKMAKQNFNDLSNGKTEFEWP